MSLRVALISVLLAVPAGASAQVVRVISSEAHGATTDVVIEGDLAQVSAAISGGADAQLHQVAPQVFTPIDLGVLRYHDQGTTIESITYHRASDTELGVTIRAQIRATQEHRTLALAWENDGLVHLATVTLEARVQLTFTASGGVHAVVLGDSVAVEPHLTGLDLLGGSAPVPLQPS